MNHYPVVMDILDKTQSRINALDKIEYTILVAENIISEASFALLIIEDELACTKDFMQQLKLEERHEDFKKQAKYWIRSIKGSYDSWGYQLNKLKKGA